MTSTFLTQEAPQQSGYEAENGMALRLLFLMTHYRKPLNFTHDKLKECARILQKWNSRAERGENTSPPLEVLEAICDDMNTAKAIALMHGYYAKREGDKLFAAMLFLGLIPSVPATDLSSQEIKTEPESGRTFEEFIEYRIEAQS